MHRFFEKYIHSFEPKDALKMIDNKVDRAEDLCKEHNQDYLKELACAYDMIEDYFSSKNIDVKTHPRH